MAYRGHRKQYVFNKADQNDLSYVPVTDLAEWSYDSERGPNRRVVSGRGDSDGLVASSSGFGLVTEQVDYAATRRARRIDPDAPPVYVRTYEVVDALPRTYMAGKSSDTNSNGETAPAVAASTFTVGRVNVGTDYTHIANDVAVDNFAYDNGNINWSGGLPSNIVDTLETGDLVLINRHNPGNDDERVTYTFRSIGDNSHPAINAPYNIFYTYAFGKDVEFTIQPSDVPSDNSVWTDSDLAAVATRFYNALVAAGVEQNIAIDSDSLSVSFDRQNQQVFDLDDGGDALNLNAVTSITSGLSADSDEDNRLHNEAYVRSVDSEMGNGVVLQPVSSPTGWDELMALSNPDTIDVLRIADGRVYRGNVINDRSVVDNRGPAGNGETTPRPTGERNPFNL